MSQVALISPLKMPAQSGERSQTPGKAKTEDEGVSFDTEYEEASDTPPEAPGVSDEVVEAEEMEVVLGDDEIVVVEDVALDFDFESDASEDVAPILPMDPAEVAPETVEVELPEVPHVEAVSETPEKTAVVAPKIEQPVMRAPNATEASVVRSLVAQSGVDKAEIVPKQAEAVKAQPQVAMPEQPVITRPAQIRRPVAVPEAQFVAAEPKVEPKLETAVPTAAPAPQTTVGAMVSAVAQTGLASVSAIAVQGRDKDGKSLIASAKEPELHAIDLKPASSSAGLTQAARAEMPRGVHLQLVEIARAAQDRPVNVSLSPEELGRVRMSVSAREGQVVLMIVAEKPETLDLMRRNLAEITRSMEEAGFDQLHLSFGEGRGSGEGQGSDADSKPDDQRFVSDGIELVMTDDVADPATAVPLPASGRTASGGLDLRF